MGQAESEPTLQLQQDREHSVGGAPFVVARHAVPDAEPPLAPAEVPVRSVIIIITHHHSPSSTIIITRLLVLPLCPADVRVWNVIVVVIIIIIIISTSIAH